MQNQTEPSSEKPLETFAKQLPEGFRIEVVLTSKECSVSLLDPEGNDHDFRTNRESVIHEIIDATMHAVAMEKELSERELA